VHNLHHEFMPPGAISREQLLRHRGMAGYFQAVEVIPPAGAQISLVQEGEYQDAPPGPVLVGMQLGYVYPLKLSRLPNREGVELFPTIEVVNRLFPPEGTKTRFPVPIEISEQDIAYALNGLFVTRVVYLEDSDQALPRPDDPQQQRFIDVSPQEDPLHVADRMGRPMAILRIGSRTPEDSQSTASGLPSPPLQIYPARADTKSVDVNAAIERHGKDIPRQLDPPVLNDSRGER
jgi:hypothetical protein